ncbi:MAG: DUF2442 domain-containing protein [Actinomycetaceae bacterium]|nr:DUF2442 domain-containing protein [Actinomycetaceae bacterium]
MFVVDGVAYAGEPSQGVRVEAVRVLDYMTMLVQFSTGETRLFDASVLLDMPAFKPLENPDVFNNPTIEHGILTWSNGDIDIAPEKLYELSFEYTDQPDVSPELASLVGVVDIGDDDAVRDEYVEHVLAKSSD